VSVEFLLLVLRILCVSTPYAPVFGCSWPMSSCCSLERVCRRVCVRPVFLLPSPTSHSDVACDYLRRSILATWPPHFHVSYRPLPRYSSSWSSACCRCRQYAVSFVPSSPDSCGATSFTSPSVTMFGYLTTGPGIRRLLGRLYVSPVFGICRPVLSRNLLTHETCLPTRKENRLTETND